MTASFSLLTAVAETSYVPLFHDGRAHVWYLMLHLISGGRRGGAIRAMAPPKGKSGGHHIICPPPKQPMGPHERMVPWPLFACHEAKKNQRQILKETVHLPQHVILSEIAVL